jgi:dTMP kinase
MLVGKIRRKVSRVAFPGCNAGTLGKHVYQLHHSPERFGIEQISPLSLQLLHVAAHIDAIDNLIRPSLARGDVILLDRYWWSVWVYGVVAGANEEFLQSIIHLERRVWGEIKPAAVFLFRRASTSHSAEERALAKRLTYEYEKLALAESQSVAVVNIDNDSSVEASAQTVVSHLEGILSPALR